MSKVDEIMERWERRHACGEVDGQYLAMKHRSNVKRAGNDIPVLIEEIKRLRELEKHVVDLRYCANTMADLFDEFQQSRPKSGTYGQLETAVATYRALSGWVSLNTAVSPRRAIEASRQYADAIKGVCGNYMRGWYSALAHVEKQLVKP